MVLNQDQIQLNPAWRLRFLVEVAIVAIAVPCAQLALHSIQKIYPMPFPYIAVQGTWIGVAVAGLFLWFSRTRWRSLGLKRPERWGRAFALILLAVFAYLLTSNLMGRFVLPHLGMTEEMLSRIDDYYIGIVEGNPKQLALIMIFVIWTTAGIGEELICRGFFFNRIERAVANPALATPIALIGQAVVFGVMHLSSGAASVASATVAGLIIGLLYLATHRNLVVCIIAHGLVNSAYFIGYYNGIVI